MAKERVVKERVTLVSPKGTSVTAGSDLARRLVAKGYKATGGHLPAAPAEPAGDPAAPAPEPQEPPVEPAGDPAGDVERPSRGASLAAWAGFADTVGFTYPEGATRDQIRDAYEAEHPAE
jgi:hypothetical protein